MSRGRCQRESSGTAIFRRGVIYSAVEWYIQLLSDIYSCRVVFSVVEWCFQQWTDIAERSGVCDELVLMN